MPNDFNPTHLPNGRCNMSIAETLDLISSVFHEHVKLQNESDADALALWIAMTLRDGSLRNCSYDLCDITRAHVWQVHSDEIA